MEEMERLPNQVVTPRLILRCWEAEDVPAMGAAIEASLDHLRPWMAWAAFEPLSDDERVQLVRSWCDDWDQGGDAIYGVFHEGGVVGGCGLHRRRGPGVLEIGYWVHAQHIRQGYATELTRALTTAAFEIDGIDRVEIHHDKANVWSGAVPSSLGFEQGPEHPNEVQAPAEIGIDCPWSIRRSRWTVGDAQPELS